MTHAGVPNIKTQLANGIKFKAQFDKTLNFLMAAQRTIVRFSNNRTMHPKFRDNDAEHVESMLRLAGLVLPTEFLQLVKPSIKLHDVCEVYDEAKTTNGILFHTLTENDLPQFEKMAFEAGITWAAVSVVTANTEQDFLKQINQDKAEIGKFHISQPQYNVDGSAMACMANILDQANLKKDGLRKDQKKPAEKIIETCIKLYDDYTDPQKRQSDPIVTGIKLLDKLSGLNQLNACATGLALNMPYDKHYWANNLQTSQKMENYWECLPTAFTPSNEIIRDTCDLQKKYNLFAQAISNQCPQHMQFVEQAYEITQQVGGDYLLNQRPYYILGAPEPNWQSPASQHYKNYKAYLNGNLNSHAVSSKVIAQAFKEGLDITNQAQLLAFAQHPNQLIMH